MIHDLRELSYKSQVLKITELPIYFEYRAQVRLWKNFLDVSTFKNVNRIIQSRQSLAIRYIIVPSSDVHV